MTNESKRPIRSYVKRQGRITRGQRDALNNLMKKYALNYQSGEFDYGALFDCDDKTTQEICLEIGFGNGDTLISMASDHPEMDFIGVEVYEAGVGRLLANIEKNMLNNVRVVMHDAVEVLQKNIPDNSLSRVMIFFPDPWPKKRHHKRRLIQTQFIELVVRKLKAGAVLHCATDWENYAEQMLDVLSQNAELKNTSSNSAFVERPDFRPLTKFEQRGKRLGHGVWDLIFQKIFRG